MTIASMIGPVDVYSALVAIGAGASVTIVTCTALARSTRYQIDKNFELEKMKQASQNENLESQRRFDLQKEVAKLGQQKEIEFHRIDHGMVDLKANT